ncbi:hypothetical protein RI129_009125 [Pyrocoelia pectoralis]|uniref:FLYWCH-type domain-containing protein n=1 Tax=Pyrocoelia pectoralis TaxID=417401 RepID=A0AAN7V9W1_9COLE
MDEEALDTQPRSQRNRNKFQHNGCLYVYDAQSKRDPHISFWRCERKWDKCRARIHVNDVRHAVVQMTHSHNHDESPAHCSAAKIVTDLKNRAQETAENPAQIISHVIEGVPREVLAALPRKAALTKTVQRQRGRVHMRPPNPTDLANLDIPEAYKVYHVSEDVTERFLLIDSKDLEPEEDHSKRILVFGREGNMSWAAQMKKIYVDGTFRQAPPLFSQILTSPAIPIEECGP